MNPAMTPCTAPPGYYGGPYMPSLNPGQCGYSYPCTPVPGNYPVPFSGYGGPFPFFGAPQPYPSIPHAYGPYPGMFPPGYMVPQQAYPQPCMYGGPPMSTPSVQLQDGGAVQSPAVSPNEIPDNNQDQVLSAPLRSGDASSCASVLPAEVNHQQQMPTLTVAVHQQQMPTVTCKSPPGFPQIQSGDISPASIQWNTMVSQDGLHVPGISKSPDIEDKDDSDGSSSEFWPPSSEQSTAGCQTTPDVQYSKYITNCQQPLDLTLDTQPSRSDPSPEHSNKSVVNAQASSNVEESSYKELVTDEKGTATSSLPDLSIHDDKISEALNADPILSVPDIPVYQDTTESDTTDGPTRSTWNAANKDFPKLTNYTEFLVRVFLFVDIGLGIPSGLPLENKCWVVPWPTMIK